ncbi:hypothetical protein ABZ342_30085 [Amycolatopsis sp. NPDC005961]|uniref:hypothetical protein n=1 Tax=Amycolatopsis sp. NPDC005961 TaxID=3156720 RepID=UPI0033EBE35A
MREAAKIIPVVNAQDTFEWKDPIPDPGAALDWLLLLFKVILVGGILGALNRIVKLWRRAGHEPQARSSTASPSSILSTGIEP